MGKSHEQQNSGTQASIEEEAACSYPIRKTTIMIEMQVEHWGKLGKRLEDLFVHDNLTVSCNKSQCEILFKQIIPSKSNGGNFKFNKHV